MEASERLIVAEAALESGDYGQCISLLEKVLKGEGLSTEYEGQVQLLMITAYMGQGKDQEAISICKSLLKNTESSLRQEAKQLLSILQAPELERPKSWSVKIPNLKDALIEESSYSYKKSL